MSRGKSKNKRKINEGLRRYNQVRSYLSKYKKASGSKFTNIELNDATKSFLILNRDKKYRVSDIKSFYQNAEKIRRKKSIDLIQYEDLEPFQYYETFDNMDYLQKKFTEKKISVIIKFTCGRFGNIEFDIESYDYYASGLSAIISDIQKEVHPDGDERDNHSGKFKFIGLIQERDDEQEYPNQINFLLHEDNEPIDGIKIGDFIVTESIKSEALKETDTLIKRVKKRVIKEKANKKEKQKTKKIDSSVQLSLEKERQKTLKLENKQLKLIAELLKMGVTKKELKKRGLL